MWKKERTGERKKFKRNSIIKLGERELNRTREKKYARE